MGGAHKKNPPSTQYLVGNIHPHTEKPATTSGSCKYFYRKLLQFRPNTEESG